MNDLMSGGLHRLWKDRLVAKLRPFPGMQHLDVAGGTGDVAFRVVDAIMAAESKLEQPKTYMKDKDNEVDSDDNNSSSRKKKWNGGGTVTVFDINSDMLREGQKRAQSLGYTSTLPPHHHLHSHKHVDDDSSGDNAAAGEATASSSSTQQHPVIGRENRLSWVQGDAQDLPFNNNTFDSYTVAFGIRNVTNRPAALQEAYRVLKPGGRLLCLEFSRPTLPGLNEIYDLYSFSVIPKIGGLVAGDEESYKYLVESIRKFPCQEEWADMIEDAGFSGVDWENLTGGIVAVHSGFKL